MYAARLGSVDIKSFPLQLLQVNSNLNASPGKLRLMALKRSPAGTSEVQVVHLPLRGMAMRTIMLPEQKLPTNCQTPVVYSQQKPKYEMRC